MTKLKNPTEVETEMEIWSRNKLVINQWPHNITATRHMRAHHGETGSSFKQAGKSI